MSNTGERMLELLGLLQVRHRWPGRDLADRLGVSERTLRRDVDRLRELGYPVRADRGVDGGYQLGSGSKLPPLLLSDDEAVAIAIGLRSAANQPITGIAESSMGALVKVGQLLPPALKARVESIAPTQDTPPLPGATTIVLDTVTTIARASRDSDRVRFDYRTQDGQALERHVEPHYVVPIDQRWYVITWDLDRDDWRTFRLDRIANARTTNRRFDRRSLPAADPTTFIRQTIATLRSVHDVELIVETPIEAVLRHMGPWGSAEPIDAYTTRIEMSIPDLAWAVLMLAILRAEIRSVEPEELREFLGDLVDRLQTVAGG